MPIYFRNTPINEPFIFDSIGNHWEQDRVVRPEGYPLYHYLQTESGRGRIEIQGKTYLLEEGEGVLIAPFVSHSYGALTEQWTTIFVTITGSLESSIGKLLGDRPVIFIPAEQGRMLQEQIDRTVQKYENPPVDTKQLSVDCYGFLMNFVDGVHGKEREKDPLYQKYVAPVVKEIETNFGERLTADELSRKVYVTPQYLSRLFRRFLGCPVYEYLTTYRITKAKELLLNAPRLEVGYIAHQTGFEDASHFIAIFRKRTGMTPLEFRGLHKVRE